VALIEVLKCPDVEVKKGISFCSAVLQVLIASAGEKYSELVSILRLYYLFALAIFSFEPVCSTSNNTKNGFSLPKDDYEFPFLILRPTFSIMKGEKLVSAIIEKIFKQKRGIQEVMALKQLEELAAFPMQAIEFAKSLSPRV
jgi:hypothetical protein